MVGTKWEESNTFFKAVMYRLGVEYGISGPVIYFRMVSEATSNYFKLMGITYFSDRFKFDYSAAG